MRRFELLVFAILILLYINKSIDLVYINNGWLALIHFVGFLFFAIAGSKIYRSRGGENFKHAKILAIFCGLSFGLAIFAIFSKTFNWFNTFNITLAVPNAILFFILLYLVFIRLKNKRFRSARFYSRLLYRSGIILVISATIISMPYYLVNIYFNKGEPQLYYSGLAHKYILQSYNESENGKYQDALRSIKKVDEYNILAYGDDSTKYYNTSRYLYEAYWGLIVEHAKEGQVDKSLHYSDLIRNPLKEAFGDSSEENAALKMVIAGIYHGKGNYKISDSLYIETMNFNKSYYGYKNIAYAETLHLYANSKRERNYYDYSIDLYKSVIDIIQGDTGKYASKVSDFSLDDFKNDRIASATADLAFTYSLYKQFDSADYYFQKAFSIKSFVSSVDYSQSLINNAYHTLFKGDLKMAKSLMEKALKIAREKHTENNYIFLNALSGLNNINLSLANYKDAEIGCNKAISIFTNISPVKTNYYSELLSDLAQVKYQLASYDSADRYFFEALSYANEGSLNYAEILNSISTLKINLTQYADAQKYASEATSIAKNIIVDTESPFLLKFYRNDAYVHYTWNELKKSENLYLKCLKIEKKAKWFDKSGYAETLNGLGLVKTQNKKYIVADTLFDAAYKILSLKLGNSHPQVGTLLYNKGYLMLSQGNLQEAEMFFEKSLTIMTRKFGTNHDKVADNLKALGELRIKQKRSDEAMENLNKALKIYESKFKPGNLKIISTQKLINSAKIQN